MRAQSNRKSAGAAVLKGAAILSGAAVVSKIIGTLQKIPLQNLGGDEVFGLYSAVNALAVMWMTLAVAGVPTAVSVLVAEREAAGDETGSRRIVRWAMGLIVISGLAAFAAMQAGAPLFARWMGAPDAAAAIRASSLALLAAPCAAVLRGARQGQMSMIRPAVSQVAEQTARVAFMLIMLLYALAEGWRAPAVAAAVHGGLAAGAAAGLIVMLWPDRRRQTAGQFLREARMQREEQENGRPSRSIWWEEPGRALVRRILAVAFPVAAASAAAPLIGLIDAFQVPRLLKESGAWQAMVAFGVYNRGISLLQLVLVAAAGAAAAMVPAWTGSRIRGESAGPDAIAGAQAVLRTAWWLGGAAAAGLALLAEPVNVMLFADDRGSRAIVLLSPALAFGAVQAASGGLLQGLGDMRSPAVNMAVAAIFKMALNILLVPVYGIDGAALAMSLAYGAAALLNALSLRQRLPLPGVRLRQALRSAAALSLMAAAVWLTARGLAALASGLPERAAALIVALPSVFAGIIALATGLIAAGAAGPAWWRLLPGCAAGSRADAALMRLHAAVRRSAHRSIRDGKDDPS